MRPFPRPRPAGSSSASNGTTRSATAAGDMAESAEPAFSRRNVWIAASPTSKYSPTKLPHGRTTATSTTPKPTGNSQLPTPASSWKRPYPQFEHPGATKAQFPAYLNRRILAQARNEERSLRIDLFLYGLGCRRPILASAGARYHSCGDWCVATRGSRAFRGQRGVGGKVAAALVSAEERRPGRAAGGVSPLEEFAVEVILI